jgi:hypothetical protein
MLQKLRMGVADESEGAEDSHLEEPGVGLLRRGLLLEGEGREGALDLAALAKPARRPRLGDLGVGDRELAVLACLLALKTLRQI